MTAQSGTTRPPAGGLASQFSIESHILSTRSADGFKAVDRVQGIGVCLWMLRHPLPQNSDAIRRFLSRTARIKEIDPPVSEITNFGVDQTGMAFAVLPNLDGYPVASGNLEPAEAERRFISCLRLVERLHAAGVVCGDLCASSFWVARSGDLQFIGVMGSFDTEAAATAMLPPMETLNFVAPEQRAGGGLEPASDVFALGVLGYHLFTGAYPYPSGAAMFTGEFSPDQIKPLSAFMPVVPVWAEEVLMRCLQSKPTARYANAGEVYKAIVDLRQKSAGGERSLTKSQRDAVLVGRGKTEKTAQRPLDQMPLIPEARHDGAAHEAAQSVVSPGARRVVVLVLLLLIAIGVGIGVFMSKRDAAREAERNKDITGLKDAAGSEKIETAINVITQKEASVQERESQLEKLSNSDDPLAAQLLLNTAKSAKTEQERNQSEKAIIDRARRLGLMRAAEQVRQWLRTLRANELPACYESALRALDTTLPIDARGKALKQVYASNPKLALRLTAALALDTNKFDDYQPILAQLLNDYTHSEDLGSHSLLALILSDSELALVYGDDVIQRRDQIPETDTIWVLKVLADRNDQSVRAIANLAMERDLLSPIRKVFLGYVRDRSDLPPEVLSALIRAAAGSLKVPDIGIFGRWYDTDSERVLLAVMADNTDKDLLTETFDTIAGKTVSSEPAASLISWVRENHWDQRADLAHAIGVLSNLDTMGDAAFDSLTPVFDKFSKEKGFIDLLLSSHNPKLARLVADRYGDRLGIAGMMNLLGDPDKQVRMTAIKGLKDVNEIAILKLIIDKYETEKDPEVKQMYRDTFWMIREREGKK